MANSFFVIFVIVSGMAIVNHSKADDLKSKGFEWRALKQNVCAHEDEYRFTNETIKVEVLIVIMSVFHISEDKMEFDVQILLYLFWRDPNLMHNSNLEDISFSILPPKVLDCIWHPPMVFYNSKKSKMYQDTVPNTLGVWFMEKVVKMARYHLTLSCNMNFRLFPMDSQYCSVDMAMLTPPVKYNIELGWSDYIQENEALSFNNFQPLNYMISYNGRNITNFNFAGQEKSVLRLNLLFVRSLVASVVNTYIPSFLIVCLSMVSFWLDVNAVPGRVTLGVTAILTLATTIAHVRSALPTLDYLTAMDVWLLGCMVTVFLSLIEFTLAQAATRKASSLETLKAKKNEMKKNLEISNKRSSLKIYKYRSKSSVRRIAALKSLDYLQNQIKPQKPTIEKDNLLDRVSRVVFPLSFTTFTVLYWVYYIKYA